MVRLALLLLLLFAAPACSSDAPDAKALAVLPNFAVQTPTLSTSGKLQAGDVAVVAKAGIRHVINLRPDSETPEFNEAAAVRDAGLQYRVSAASGGRGVWPAPGAAMGAELSVSAALAF